MSSPTHLVMSGGGVKAYSLVGALLVLKEHGYLDSISTLAGSSMGGLVAALYAIGYTPDELHQIMMGIDLQEFVNIDIANFPTNYGLDDGALFVKLLRSIFRQKKVDPDITFAELAEEYDRTLVLTGTNITKERTDYFSPSTTPDMPVILAIRISTSYPVIFCPVVYEGMKYVDGGLLNNYPMDYFDDVAPADKLGILIDNRNYYDPDYSNKIEGIVDMYMAMLSTVINGQIKRRADNYRDRTLYVQAEKIFACNFEIILETKEKLFNLGYDHATTWCAEQGAAEQDSDSDSDT